MLFGWIKMRINGVGKFHNFLFKVNKKRVERNK